MTPGEHLLLQLATHILCFLWGHFLGRRKW